MQVDIFITVGAFGIGVLIGALSTIAMFSGRVARIDAHLLSIQASVTSMCTKVDKMDSTIDVNSQRISWLEATTGRGGLNG